jgi:hypothetical protein
MNAIVAYAINEALAALTHLLSSIIIQLSLRIKEAACTKIAGSGLDFGILTTHNM